MSFIYSLVRSLNGVQGDDGNWINSYYNATLWICLQDTNGAHLTFCSQSDNQMKTMWGNDVCNAAFEMVESLSMAITCDAI